MLNALQIQKEAGEMTVGDVVKLRPEWSEPNETGVRYVIVEHNGSRLLISCISIDGKPWDLPLPGIELVAREHIEVA